MAGRQHVGPRAGWGQLRLGQVRASAAAAAKRGRCQRRLALGAAKALPIRSVEASLSIKQDAKVQWSIAVAGAEERSSGRHVAGVREEWRKERSALRRSTCCSQEVRCISPGSYRTGTGGCQCDRAGQPTSIEVNDRRLPTARVAPAALLSDHTGVPQRTPATCTSQLRIAEHSQGAEREAATWCGRKGRFAAVWAACA